MGEYKINKIKVLKFKLVLETGLHIGGNKDNFGIGGIDSPVIKNPLNNQPIIPGSSLKGKIRMLLETVETEEYSASKNKELVEKMFGTKENKPEKETARVVFRDLSLTEESVKELQSKLGTGFFTEVKAENTIIRGKVSAMPRFQERVPAGAVFGGECAVYTFDDNKDVEELLKIGFKLLEKNYLGGSGTRGYGKIKVEF